MGHAFLLIIVCLFLTGISAKRGKSEKDITYKRRSVSAEGEYYKYKRLTCTSAQFACPEKCVRADYQCDTVSDCNGGFDERNCSTDCTGPNQFKCANARCIPISFKCDHDNDCGDGSDEVPTLCGTPLSCQSGRFACANGNCINSMWVCDGDSDCGDNSDELNCGHLNCSGSQFTCTNLRCIPRAYECDGENDCGDASDETACTCDSNHFLCAHGTCLSNEFKCDGENDCGDMSDEVNCPEIHPGACADLLQYEDCLRMNTTTYPICDAYADAHKFCRKFCDLCIAK